MLPIYHVWRDYHDPAIANSHPHTGKFSDQQSAVCTVSDGLVVVTCAVISYYDGSHHLPVVIAAKSHRVLWTSI